MSKRKTRNIIAGRVNDVALVINIDTMKYLWCHESAMESVECLTNGNPEYGCDIGDLESFKRYIKNGTRILI